VQYKLIFFIVNQGPAALGGGLAAADVRKLAGRADG
jgi:hypothetical protein